MNGELQKQLVEKYPKFFEYLKEYKGPLMPISFGFECGDGWHWLISQLMDTIYSYCENNKKEIPNIVQIKEKFGGLRFYIHGGDETVHGMIWLAESMSYHICEFCGTTENMGQTSGWITTACENCAKERELHLWKKYE